MEEQHEHDMAAHADSAHAAADVVEEGLHAFHAEWDAEGVYFYQAFSDEISEWALRASNASVGQSST